MVMMRYHVINDLINRFGYKSYLEIGISVGKTWRNVECEKKVGVEPNPIVDDERIFIGTSDSYFALHYTGTRDEDAPDNEERFDLIFIDGLHLADQVIRDIEHSLDRLNPGGTIVVHDCNPPTEEHGAPRPMIWRQQGHSVWCGTVWQGWVNFRMRSQYMFSCTVDCDFGVGIIRPGDPSLCAPVQKPPYPLTWEYFDANRDTLLNLILDYKTLDELWQTKD